MSLKEGILNTCKQIAKGGQTYHVNRYRYSESQKRAACFELKAEGKIKQGDNHGKLLTFFRPEDKELIENVIKEREERIRNF